MKPEILYHYCSQEAFLSILRGKSFRCSALSLSNDTMEGKWIRKIFSKICDEDGLEEHQKNRVLNMLKSWTDSNEGFGFCLSEDQDLLNQWKNYAQNFEGFCIGFSKKGLKALREKTRQDNVDNEPSFRILKVNYDIESQKEELKPRYQEIKDSIKKEGKGEKSPDGLSGTVALGVIKMLSKIFKQKNPDFEQEKEWRVLYTHFNIDPTNIKYHIVRSSKVPYRCFEFDPKIITEVILGSKNQTSVESVKHTLEKFGYFKLDSKGKKILLVNVEKSKASY